MTKNLHILYSLRSFFHRKKLKRKERKQLESPLSTPLLRRDSLTFFVDIFQSMEQKEVESSSNVFQSTKLDSAM